MVRRGRHFAARGVRQDERQSKGGKELRAGGFCEKRHAGNRILLKR